MSAFGDKLAALRSASGYSQRQFAAMLGVSGPYLNQVEVAGRPAFSHLNRCLLAAQYTSPEEWLALALSAAVERREIRVDISSLPEEAVVRALVLLKELLAAPGSEEGFAGVSQLE